MANKDALTIPTIAAENCLPAPVTGGAAGADLRNAQNVQVVVERGTVVTIPTGVRIAIPHGHFGMLALRSSMGRRGLAIPNGVGVIDADYRGEIGLIVTNLTDTPITIEPGERVGQLIIIPIPAVTYTPVESLDETDRGEGGFGSTGTH